MILAMALTVIFRIFAGGMRNVSLSQDYARAELLADSQLSAAGMEHPLQAGISAGDWGERFTWERSIEAYEPWPDGRRVKLPVRAYRVTVKVSWNHGGGEREVVLSSVKLQPIDPLQRRI